MHLVCGEALFDLFLKDGAVPSSLEIDGRAGGSPFNVAIGMVRQGAAVGLCTGISEDLLGERLVALLSREGVNTEYLVRTGRRTTLSIVDLSTDSAPAYAFYGLGSADCSLTSADLPDIGDGLTGLHFGSYSIVVEPAASAFAALAARNKELFISLDPNIRPTVEPDPDIWRKRIHQMLTVARLVKASSEDLELLYPESSIGAIISGWLGMRPELVVITDGGSAVHAFHKSGSLSVLPPKVDVADTVGAGDAFQAALLAELQINNHMTESLDNIADKKLEQILRYAAEVAAVTCTRRGADIPKRTPRSRA
jgi:fructokinase